MQALTSTTSACAAVASSSFGISSLLRCHILGRRQGDAIVRVQTCSLERIAIAEEDTVSTAAILNHCLTSVAAGQTVCRRPWQQCEGPLEGAVDWLGPRTQPH